MSELLKISESTDIKLNREEKGIDVTVEINFVSMGNMDPFIREDGSVDRDLLSNIIFDKIKKLGRIELNKINDR